VVVGGHVVGEGGERGGGGFFSFGTVEVEAVEYGDVVLEEAKEGEGKELEVGEETRREKREGRRERRRTLISVRRSLNATRWKERAEQDKADTFSLFSDEKVKAKAHSPMN